MHRIIDRFNTESGHDLKLRAGIDTGAVSSGLIGRTSLAYDLWGQAVNLAFQVQSGAPQPGIYVTTGVYDAMRDSRQFASAAPITVDGTEQPVWRLLERQS
jgi:class 3 adenylate cyclase